MCDVFLLPHQILMTPAPVIRHLGIVRTLCAHKLSKTQTQTQNSNSEQQAARLIGALSNIN